MRVQQYLYMKLIKINLFLVYTKNCGFEINTSIKNRVFVIELSSKKMINEFEKIYIFWNNYYLNVIN